MEDLDCMDMNQDSSQCDMVSGLRSMLMAANSVQSSHKSKQQPIDAARLGDGEVLIA